MLLLLRNQRRAEDPGTHTMTRAGVIYMLSRGDENLLVVRGWIGQDFFGGCWKSQIARQEDRQLQKTDDLH